jgi:bifunctional non-homologous end joining protein LigD
MEQQQVTHLATEALVGKDWIYEIKWDGYRAIAFKTGGRVHLRSRNDNDFALRYPGATKALSGLPDDTVIDGEIVALNESGRPSFNILQNYGTAQDAFFYYVFDVLVLKEKDLRGETLAARRAILTKLIGKLRGTRQRIGSARRSPCGHPRIR